MKTEYRVITNGKKFRIEESFTEGFWKWKKIKWAEAGDWSYLDDFYPYEFNSEKSARNYITTFLVPKHIYNIEPWTIVGEINNMKVIVNAKETNVSTLSLTYDTAVNLAGYENRLNNTLYTVTYHSPGRLGGSLTPGQSTPIYMNMIVNVAYTGNA
jgi:hypothetical protein